MATLVSKLCEWYPAKEKVSLKNKSGKTITVGGKKIGPGEDFIYEGPDRGALMLLEKVGTVNAECNKVLGENFMKNTEFLQSVRNMGFNDTESYLAFIGYDKEKEEENFKKKASVVTNHDLPKRAEEAKIIGGGQDTSGGGLDRYGGMGPVPLD